MNGYLFLDEKEIATFETFAEEYPLYGSSITSTYHIVRDIIIKQEVSNVSIVDGSACGLAGYMIHCSTKAHHRKRVMVPWSADAEVDLLWCV